MTSPVFLIAFVLLTLLSTAAIAEPEARGERRGPPPEALEACSTLSEGDDCSFSGRRGEALTGSCFVPPRDEAVLACRPDNPPPRDREMLDG